MRHLRSGLLLFVLLLLVAGCGARMRNPKEPSMSLVYGYLDMTDAPTPVDVVTIRQYEPKPKNGNPYYRTRSASGVFWFDQLLPGVYQVIGFSGEGAFSFKHEYFLAEQEKNDSSITINKPGLHYIGSFKYIKKGSYFNPKFDFQKAQTPSEREVLDKMLSYSMDTQWDGLIRQRIKELKK